MATTRLEPNLEYYLVEGYLLLALSLATIRYGGMLALASNLED